MSKALEYIRDISCLIAEYYSDKEPLTEEQKLSKNCFLDYCKYIAKELKAFEIIKEKYVDLVILRDVDIVEKYNKYIKLSYCRKELTQEEFKLLKEVVKQ